MNQAQASTTFRQRGFTLIEIMVVVVIIGILAVAVVPRIMDSPDKARVAMAKQNIRAIKNALDLYKYDNFNYPSTDQGLEALVSKPSGEPQARNWKQGGYVESLPRDPWGNEYHYLSPGSRRDVDIFSYGADGRPGGDGFNTDIGNWTLD